MKLFRSLLLFLFLLLHEAKAQQPQQFTLTDTSFTVGSVYAPGCVIWFNLDSHYFIRTECHPCLDTFAIFMKNHPELVIEIASYTVQRGADSTNAWWAQRRSERIRDYLEMRGVSPMNIAAVGYGEVDPVVKESEIQKKKTREEREELDAKNSRILFRIIYVFPAVFHPFSPWSTWKLNAVWRPLLLFDFNKPTLRPESLPVLDTLALFMQANIGVTIDIGVYPDTRYSDAASSCVPCSRAKALRDSLVARGISPDRITYHGDKGKSPLISAAYIRRVPSKDGREQLQQLNRRVEIKLTTVSGK